MKLLPVKVLVLDEAGDQRFENAVAEEPLVYADGSIEIGVDSGDGDRTYLRFDLAELLRLALATTDREEAP